MEPDAVEIRVVGCLIEKQRATPDAYPLSLNSLRLACNQATNRDPGVRRGPLSRLAAAMLEAEGDDAAAAGDRRDQLGLQSPTLLQQRTAAGAEGDLEGVEAPAAELEAAPSE